MGCQGVPRDLVSSLGEMAVIKDLPRSQVMARESERIQNEKMYYQNSNVCRMLKYFGIM